MSGDSLELVAGSRAVTKGGGSDRSFSTERRKRVRIRLHWPVVMFRGWADSDAVESITCDLSSSGFYCLSAVHLIEGEQLMCSIRIPSHNPDRKSSDRTLQCRVRVTRVVPQDTGDLFGVACRIEDYHLCDISPSAS